MLYINTYHPLVRTAPGRETCCANDLPPFIDGSIRREPDLEHRWPAISCLCRAGKFAPRLHEGDWVVYLTAKDRYGGEAPHWRLTAVLKVLHRFEKHEDAAAWYRDRGALPSNCMVPGNPPLPLALSHGKTQYAGCSPASTLSKWDAQYRKRASQHGTFLACKPVFRELSWAAPIVHKHHLKKALGRVPGTQNPAPDPPDRLRKLMRQLQLDVPPSVP